jgi:hypothetical protein
MPRRNRLTTVLIMPVAVLLWSLGWVFYWTGAKSKRAVLELPLVEKQESEMQFAVIMPEQQIAE